MKPAFLCLPLAMLLGVGAAHAQMVLDSYTRPITENEIASFKSFMQTRSVPPHPWGFNDNDHNDISDGPAGRDVEAMGLMYEATGDVEILNRMIDIQMMLNGGYQRDAEAHEILGDDPERVARYDAVVQTSVRECLDGMKHAYAVGGQTVYKMGYYPWSTSLNESVGHGNYDVLGI